MNRGDLMNALQAAHVKATDAVTASALDESGKKTRDIHPREYQVAQFEAMADAALGALNKLLEPALFEVVEVADDHGARSLTVVLVDPSAAAPAADAPG